MRKVKIKSLYDGERFKVNGVDSIHYLMDSGEGEVFFADKAHNRLICGTTIGELTEREASFCKQTLSSGDYFDYKGRIHTLIVIPETDIHAAILRFIGVKSNF